MSKPVVLVKNTDKNLLRSKWPVVFFIASALLILTYLFATKDSLVAARSTFGLFSGILAMIITLSLSFYRVRKKIYTIKLGSLHGWYQAHIYLGLLTLLLLLLHTGMRVEGLVNTVFYIFFVLVILSGLLGALIYSVTPLSLAKYGRELLLNEEVDEMFAKYLADADRVVESSTDEFKKVYEGRLRPLFNSRRALWKNLFLEERQVIEDVNKTFYEMRRLVPDESIYNMDLLNSLYVERARLVFTQSKVQAMRWWLNVHVPLVAGMLTISLFHIFSILYY